MKRNYIVLLIAIFGLANSGCSTKRVSPISIEDNPAHHYVMGMQLIEKKRLSEAESSFERAIQLDPDYAPAIAGESLVMTMNANNQNDAEHKKVEMKRALKHLKKACSKAKGDWQEFEVSVTAIRVYTCAQTKGWLSKTKDYYEDALDIDSVNEQELIYYQTKVSAHYFMGEAFLKAYEFHSAEITLANVMSTAPGHWHEPATIMYKRVQKIIHATLQYTLADIGKKIAAKDMVTRSDVAALLIDEIHLDRFFEGRIPSREKEDPELFVPSDLQNHIFRAEMLTAMKWKVRGIEPGYDTMSRAYLIYPDKPVNRKELAFILEDLLAKITGDIYLASKFVGSQKSPYPDVDPSAAWFNPIMNVVNRGLMEPDISGEFRPDDAVDGAELLLAVVRLRNVMNIY